jgi:membrane protein DedA with SNARE-associated domain/rhodanese-related sulfurtransferase
LQVHRLPALRARSNMPTHAVGRGVDFPGIAMQELVDRYGVLLVFVNVLALSLGLPVPAMPTLILVGAGLALHADPLWLPLAGVLGVSVLASLIGDSVWFYAGRRYGNRTLQSLCRLSLSRDTCMKRTERFYGRFGIRILSVAKFIPGLSMVSVPLAGAMQARLPGFLRYDGLGAALWAALGLGLGVVFANQVESVIEALSQLGTGAVAVIVAALVAYIGWRWWRRRTLLRSLEASRIDVAGLDALVRAGQPPVVFDIRAPGFRDVDPYVIPGAVFADERQLDGILAAYPREGKIVIYCACPDEVSAAWMAARLREAGFRDVLPLRGGIDAWRAAGYGVDRLGG